PLSGLMVRKLGLTAPPLASREEGERFISGFLILSTERRSVGGRRETVEARGAAKLFSLVAGRAGARCLPPTICRLVAEDGLSAFDRDEGFVRRDRPLPLGFWEHLVEQLLVGAAHHRVGVGNAEHMRSDELRFQR